MDIAPSKYIHIDHICPCAAFDLSNDPDPRFKITIEQAVCFFYKNLQPLWSWENLSKSDSHGEFARLFAYSKFTRNNLYID